MDESGYMGNFHERIRVEQEQDWLSLLDVVDGFRDAVVAHCIVDSGGHVCSDSTYVIGEGMAVWLLVQIQRRENPAALIRLNDVRTFNVNPSMDVEPAEASFGERVNFELSFLRASCRNIDVMLLGSEWLGFVSLRKLEEEMALFDL